jgi:hypothetical protein
MLMKHPVQTGSNRRLPGREITRWRGMSDFFHNKYTRWGALCQSLQPCGKVLPCRALNWSRALGDRFVTGWPALCVKQAVDYQPYGQGQGPEKQHKARQVAHSTPDRSSRGGRIPIQIGGNNEIDADQLS